MIFTRSWSADKFKTIENFSTSGEESVVSKAKHSRAWFEYPAVSSPLPCPHLSYLHQILKFHCLYCVFVLCSVFSILYSSLSFEKNHSVMDIL